MHTEASLAKITYIPGSCPALTHPKRAANPVRPLRLGVVWLVYAFGAFPIPSSPNPRLCWKSVETWGGQGRQLKGSALQVARPCRRGGVLKMAEASCWGVGALEAITLQSTRCRAGTKFTYL